MPNDRAARIAEFERQGLSQAEAEFAAALEAGEVDGDAIDECTGKAHDSSLSLTDSWEVNGS